MIIAAICFGLVAERGIVGHVAIQQATLLQLLSDDAESPG